MPFQPSGEPVRCAVPEPGPQTTPCPGDPFGHGCPFALAWEKMVLFLTFVNGMFFRMSWRRCLTPGRAEFSRHAEGRPIHKCLETAYFRGGQGERTTVPERIPARQDVV